MRLENFPGAETANSIIINVSRPPLCTLGQVSRRKGRKPAVGLKDRCERQMSVLSENRIYQYLKALGRETLATSWELIRIMVPVIAVTKILDELGFISILSGLLDPAMNLLGLPGELGLVWATSMLTSLYGGMAVFASLAHGLDLTVAQLTVLCSVMLIAHSLPVEMSISKRAGAPFLPILMLRLGGALVYGFLLDRVCLLFDIWQQRAVLLFAQTAGDADLPVWALQQGRNICLMIFIIFCIIVIMRVLRRIGVLNLLERLLTPVLPLFGMTGQAAPVTVVGMIMGMGYGGALIIREAQTGKMGRDEIFYSMALMGLCHGLIEDTLLMAALGGKFAGILWGRIAFSLLVIYLIARRVKSRPASTALSSAE